MATHPYFPGEVGPRLPYPEPEFEEGEEVEEFEEGEYGEDTERDLDGIDPGQEDEE